MKIELLKASAWLVAGIAVAVFLVGRTLDMIRLVQANGATFARVTETFDDERENDRGRVGFVTVAVYEFSVRDTRFVGKTEGAQGEFSVGDTLPIQYDPKDPSVNRAKGDRRKFLNYFLMLIVGGFFSYYTITINFPVIRRFLTSSNNPPRQPIPQ